MKVLFVSANLGGNVPPTMAIARELCRRGVQVEIAGLLVGEASSADSAVSAVSADAASADAASADAGGATAPIEVNASWTQRRDTAGNPQPLGPTLSRIFLSRRLVAETEALIRDRRPDVVVVDCMALALIKGANRGGVPVVVLLHTFAEYWRRAFLHGPVAAIFGALGFSPRTLWGAATSRLLLTDAVLDPARADPAFADYVWTGTTEVGATEPPHASPPAPPRVIVSFSTTPLPGMRRAYRNAIEALRELPVEGIVTTGGFDLGHPLPTAPNVQIHGFVPHAEVFPGSALLIGHGGHSTTMKALAHGIPLLVLPLNATADQSLIGDVIETSGLGRRLSRRASPSRIRQEVSELLQNPEVHERAELTAARLRSSPPGAEVAADQIIAAATR